MARSSAIAAACVSAALAACYAPKFEDGLPCSAMMQCPAGQRCDETANPPVCHPIGAGGDDGGPDGPPAIDAIDGDMSLDTDHDTIDDSVDNCRTVANLDQRDHDADQVGDACDDCPGIANTDQADTTEGDPDGVGDACDPWPTQHDRIAVFDGFYSAPLAPTWQVFGSSSVDDGWLVPDPAAAFADSSVLHTSTFPTAARIAIEVRAEVTAVDATKQFPSVKVMLEQHTHGGGASDDYECGLSEDTTVMPHQRAIDMHTVIFDDYMYLDGQNVPLGGTIVTMREAFERTAAAPGHLTCRAVIGPTGVDLTATDARLAAGLPGFYAYRARARFDYAVIYTDQP